MPWRAQAAAGSYTDFNQAACSKTVLAEMSRHGLSVPAPSGSVSATVSVEQLLGAALVEVRGAYDRVQPL